MMGYMTMINAVFALLIVGAMNFTRHGVTPEFLLNLLFYYHPRCYGNAEQDHVFQRNENDDALPYGRHFRVLHCR